jgi:hypothetical protein
MYKYYYENSEEDNDEEIENYNPYDVLDEMNKEIDLLWKNVIINYIENPTVEILQKLDKFDSHKFYEFMTNNSSFYKTIIEDIKEDIKKQKIKDNIEEKEKQIKEKKRLK